VQSQSTYHLHLAAKIKAHQFPQNSKHSSSLTCSTAVTIGALAIPKNKQNKLQQNWLYQIILSTNIFYHYYNLSLQLNIPDHQAHFQSHLHHYPLHTEHFAKVRFPINTNKTENNTNQNIHPYNDLN
jgi:hypothetical protein